MDAITATIDSRSYYERTGNRISAVYTLSKLYWLKRHLPDIYGRSRWVLNTKDALYAFLTGHAGMTDYSDAGLTGAFNLQIMAWDDTLLCSLGLLPSLMPEIRPAHDVPYGLCKKVSLQTGLPEGIPVVIGGGDGACASHGAGLFKAGNAYCSIGSSAWIRALSGHPAIDRGMRLFSYPDLDGCHFNVCGTVQAAGAAFDWVRETLFLSGQSKPKDFNR